ncbi:MAG TPA: hypothetical protein VKE26_07810 [Xanthobacteraceae bacterium]|nr:hypothetical protein [Xanthobacteraceae bacterium]
MRLCLVAASLCLAIVANSTAILAQVQQQQRQEATVSTGVVPMPGAPADATVATATVRTYTYQPVCELRREQFVDAYGWRVRDVRVCR